MCDIADNGHPQPSDPALPRLDGHHIKQGLGGMLVRTVAGIDDGLFHQFRQHVGCTGGIVPDHNHIRIHRLQISGHVDKGLSLDNTAGGR